MTHLPPQPPYPPSYQPQPPSQTTSLPSAGLVPAVAEPDLTYRLVHGVQEMMFWLFWCSLGVVMSGLMWVFEHHGRAHTALMWDALSDLPWLALLFLGIYLGRRFNWPRVERWCRKVILIDFSTVVGSLIGLVFFYRFSGSGPTAEFWQGVAGRLWMLSAVLVAVCFYLWLRTNRWLKEKARAAGGLG